MNRVFRASLHPATVPSVAMLRTAFLAVVAFLAVAVASDEDVTQFVNLLAELGRSMT